MQRVTAHEARYVHLAWIPSEDAFEFRLMYGKRYLTPRFFLTPLDWYRLLTSQLVQLKDTEGELWVQLSRRNSHLLIVAIHDLFYDIGEEVIPAKWPLVRFNDFYRAAETERGAKPEEGWSAIYEAYMDEQRDQWGPA